MPACRSSTCCPPTTPPTRRIAPLVEHRLRELRPGCRKRSTRALIGELLVTISRSRRHGSCAGRRTPSPARCSPRCSRRTMPTRDAFLRGVSGTDWWSEGGMLHRSRSWSTHGSCFPPRGECGSSPSKRASRPRAKCRVRTLYSLMSIGTETTILHAKYDPGHALRGAFLVSSAEDRRAGRRARRRGRHRRRGIRSRRLRLHADGAHVALDARCRAMLARAGRPRSQVGLLVRTRQDCVPRGTCGAVRAGRHGADRRRRSGRADGGALGAVRRAREHHGRRSVRAPTAAGANAAVRPTAISAVSPTCTAPCCDASQGEGFELVVDTTGNPAVFAAAPEHRARRSASSSCSATRAIRRSRR